MKTARLLGIKTVALSSEPDAASPHVQMADEAVCVGSHRVKFWGNAYETRDALTLNQFDELETF